MNNLKVFGKFLDQPILISKLNKKMPFIMALGGSALFLKATHDTFSKEPDKDKAKKELTQKAIVMTSAIISAFLAPKIASKITKRIPLDSIQTVQRKNSELIDSFVKNSNCNKDTLDILNRAKKHILSFGDVKALADKFEHSNSDKEFLDKLIPEPQNIKAKDIFSEISYLSIYGAIPVVGGILGGIGADIVCRENYKEKIPDKVNEGIYQYLANIFMCNIGAGAALKILEALKITSKSARAFGMCLGIILTGVLGGSKIANLIASKLVNPIVCPNKKLKERKPEPLDLCMHTDDIATVSLLSGLKWIEPALPILYSVSGYKAGVGYRN